MIGLFNNDRFQLTGFSMMGVLVVNGLTETLCLLIFIDIWQLFFLFACFALFIYKMKIKKYRKIHSSLLVTNNIRSRASELALYE